MLFTTPGHTSDSPLIISELRFRGPNGDEDEFIEIYNNNNFPHVVNSSDGSSGYALVASDGAIRFIIPNGTVIPGRGHYLGVNSDGYSLASYPAGVGTTATGDTFFTTDIPDRAGVALFSSSNSANFTAGFRMDAVGSTNVSNALFKEGAGFTPLIPFNINYSYFRRVFTSGDAVGQPQDVDDNAADFLFADPDGNNAGAGQRLGAPGPENLSAPPGILFPVDNHTRLDPAQAERCGVW